ncbi:MAG TPA: serine hydrolase domain-containing protein [Anaerolineales bacterium]|nr:serine hydrolase domain-containing protein [Anaerolineales bacterium]
MSQPANTPRKPRRRWLLWVIGVLAACVLITTGVGLGGWLALRQRYADLEDTRDLDVRLAAEARSYLATRPAGALVIGVVKAERVAIFGFGALPDGTVPDGDTIYEIGSLSKVLTGATLAALVSTGDVSLADTLGGVIVPGASDYTRESVAPAVAIITLQQLVTHTSGLPRLPQGMTEDELISADPYAAYDEGRLWQDLAHAQLDTVPGTSYTYSNYGFGALGQALARRMDQTYVALVAERILTPLAMADTALELSADQQARLAPGMVLGTNAAAPNWNLNALAPAGGYKSTARDMTAFIAANLVAATGERGIDRALTESHTTLRTGWDATLAYGWNIQEQLWGQRVFWHNGGTGGYTSYMAIDFDNQAGIVILSNYGDAMAGSNDLDALGLVSLPLIARISLP